MTNGNYYDQSDRGDGGAGYGYRSLVSLAGRTADLP